MTTFTRVVLPATLALVLTALTASPAAAWHISGTVYCDRDNDAQIDGGDSKLSGISVRITSQVDSPGTDFYITTNGSGAYDRSLPDDPDTYRVRLSGLPTGWTVVVPSGGSHTVQLTNASSSKSGVNFLVQGCATPATTTSTSTSSTTTSTRQTTTSTRPSTTSTSTSSTTSTRPTTTTTSTRPSTTTTSSSTSTTTSITTSTTNTTLQAASCGCAGFAFSVKREAKFNNDATVNGNVLANDLDGLVRTGKNVIMPDGSVIVANAIILGNATSVYDVRSDNVFRGQGAVIRHDTLAGPSFPVSTPFCTIPTFTCGGRDILVQTGEVTHPLAPGSYGNVRVLDGGTLLLAGGTYEFCDFKTGRDTIVMTQAATTMNVVKTVSIGTGGVVEPTAGAPIPTINLAGRSLRVSQGADLHAKVSAPAAKITFGRDSMLLGCYCALQSKSDKHINLACAP